MVSTRRTQAEKNKKQSTGKRVERSARLDKSRTQHEKSIEVRGGGTDFASAPKRRIPAASATPGEDHHPVGHSIRDAANQGNVASSKHRTRKGSQDSPVVVKIQKDAKRGGANTQKKVAKTTTKQTTVNHHQPQPHKHGRGGNTRNGKFRSESRSSGRKSAGKSAKSKKSTDEETVIEVKMLTGTLYLYRGDNPRAEFIRVV